jgi:hypothetical protein
MPISGKPEIESGDPVFAKQTMVLLWLWIPAFAGMNGLKIIARQSD